MTKSAEWAQRHPERWDDMQRRSWLMQKYGLTPEQYAAILAAQGGVCAICGKPPSDPRGYRMHVDPSVCAESCATAATAASGISGTTLLGSSERSSNLTAPPANAFLDEDVLFVQDMARDCGIGFGELVKRLRHGWPLHLATDTTANARDYRHFAERLRRYERLAPISVRACPECQHPFTGPRQKKRCSSKCRNRAKARARFARPGEREAWNAYRRARRATQPREAA